MPLVFPNVVPSIRPKIQDYQSIQSKITFFFNMGEVWSIFKCMGGRGEEGLESFKALTSLIQQMHEMKLRNVWPKSPNLKMSIFYIFNFRFVLQLLRMSI